jgi:homoserine dehydrogenase
VEWTEDFEQVLASDADVVVELIGGIDPARQWIEQALLSGKSVVTANKRVMAVHGPELLVLARQTGQRLEYGGSVAGGVPVLCGLQQGLAGDQIVKLSGVLNGTCNYILSNMEARGTTFSSALAKAQELGFAEADPAEDIHGLDASCKLTILARLAFHAKLQPNEIPSRSIEGIEAIDFEFARQLGCTIRQVSTAELEGNVLRAAVRPVLVPLNSPLAQARDNQNALMVTGKHGGETLFAGRGAGGGPTAVAVVSDLVSIAENRFAAPPRVAYKQHTLSPDFSLPHYVRVNTAQSSRLKEVLKKHGLRIQSDWKGPSDRRAYSAYIVSSYASSALERVLADAGANGIHVSPPLPLLQMVAGE